MGRKATFHAPGILRFAGSELSKTARVGLMLPNGAVFIAQRRVRLHLQSLKNQQAPLQTLDNLWIGHRPNSLHSAKRNLAFRFAECTWIFLENFRRPAQE